MRLEARKHAEPTPGRVTGGSIGPRADDGVVLDLAHRAVAAVDADAERAADRRCPDQLPIDISVIEMPRICVRLTWLRTISVIDECVTMPSMPPTTLQPSTMLIPMSML